MQQRLIQLTPSTGAPATPMSPQALMFGTAPEDSPKYRDLATRLASSAVSAGWLGGASGDLAAASPVAPPVQRSPRRPLSAERALRDDTRRRQADAKLDELSRQLSKTQMALQESELRAERLCGGRTAGMRRKLSVPGTSPAVPAPAKLEGASPLPCRSLSAVLPSPLGDVRGRALERSELQGRLRSAAERLADRQAFLCGMELRAERTQQALLKMAQDVGLRSLAGGTGQAAEEARLQREAEELERRAAEILGIVAGCQTPGQCGSHVAADPAAARDAQATSVVSARVQVREEVEGELSAQSFKLADAGRELAELRHQRSNLELFLEEGKNEARRLALAETAAEERSAAAQSDIVALKDENSKLKKEVHRLEQELLGKASVHHHQNHVYRETLEQREVIVGGLQHELRQTDARLRDALAQLRTLQREEPLHELRRRELETALSERTQELEQATSDHIATKRECAESLDQVKKQRRDKDLAKLVHEVQVQERLERDKAIALARAQLEACQLRCQDEQRAAAVMQEHLEKQRQGITANEGTHARVLHELADVTDHLRMERERFGVEIRGFEASAELTQNALRVELDRARAEANALREVVASQERQLLEVRGELGRVELDRDGVRCRHREVSGGIKHYEGLLADLRASLAAAHTEREETCRRLSEQRASAEAERDRSARRASLLKSELADAQRSSADLAATLEATERRCTSNEHRLRAHFDEAEGQAKRVHDALRLENDDLVRRAVLTDRRHSDLQWKIEDQEGQHGQLHKTRAIESELLRSELEQERANAHQRRLADSERVKELEREKARYQLQGAESSRRLAQLELLHGPVV